MSDSKNTEGVFIIDLHSLDAILQVNDRTTSLVNNVIGFPCPLGKNSSYDTVADSPGALSPRNAAFKWGRQYIDYIKTVTANVWDWDVSCLFILC